MATSGRSTAAHPYLVEYHRADGAGHVRAWITDPHAYEEAVRRFLERTALGGGRTR